MCTLITASAKFEFTASLGALKFRKPYKENQSSSSYSETIGPILMIPLADLHANWMPMKCWKNQSSSISERKRARSYYYVLRPVGHQKLLQMQKFQRETWRQCQKCFRNKYIEPFNLICILPFLADFITSVLADFITSVLPQPHWSLIPSHHHLYQAKKKTKP